MDYSSTRFIEFVVRNAPGCKFTLEDANKYWKIAYELQLMTGENFKEMSIKELTKYTDPVATYNTHTTILN